MTEVKQINNETGFKSLPKFTRVSYFTTDPLLPEF